jgi:HEAT repeat protein
MPRAGSEQPPLVGAAQSAGAPRRATRWPFWVAAGVALIALALLLSETHTGMPGVWSDLLHDPGHIGLGTTLMLTLVVTLPLLAGAAAGFLAWQGARLLQLSTYLDAVRSDADRRLQAATLSRLGYVASGVPFAASGLPGMEEIRLATLLSRGRGVLLLGDDGSGKSTALAGYARALSGRRSLLPIAFGRQPLPIPVSLEWFARVSGGSDGALASSVAELLWRYGAHHLAARSVRALRHWNVVLLCDGLDEVPSDRRSQVAAHLASALSAEYPDARLVATSSLGAYLTDAPRLTSLQALERVVLTGVRAQDAPRLLRHAAHTGRARNLAARYADPATTARGLGGQLSHPATLAALTAILDTEQAPPPGRGHLVRAYADMLCASAGDDTLADAVGRLLESLAGSLRANNMPAVPLRPGDDVVAAVRQWLERSAGQHASEPYDFEALIEAARRVGIVEQPRGTDCVRFTSRSVEAVFAALALERIARRAPDPPLPADLLAPHWYEPLLLWAGFDGEPGRLAQRLLDLPASTGAWTILAPALALAAALEAWAPALDELQASDAATPRLADRTLRLVFDEVARRAPGADARQEFIHHVSVIERHGLVDLTSHLVSVARCAALGRIVRAQAIELLGGIASSVSLDGLFELLPETDAVLRDAVDRAIVAAGPLAVPRLQRALGSEDERLRLRALAALGQHREGGVAALAATTTSADARERETAARALGALRATDAVPSLAALLTDNAEAVRLAAIEALGQMRSADATAALLAHAQTGHDSERTSTAAALGETHDVAALAALLALLGDDNASVRAAAAEALGKLGKMDDERVMRSLRERLGDTDPWAQASAATALRRLGQR